MRFFDVGEFGRMEPCDEQCTCGSGQPAPKPDPVMDGVRAIARAMVIGNQLTPDRDAYIARTELAYLKNR